MNDDRKTIADLLIKIAELEKKVKVLDKLGYHYFQEFYSCNPDVGFGLPGRDEWKERVKEELKK